jgi:hypothetical protein
MGRFLNPREAASRQLESAADYEIDHYPLDENEKNILQKAIKLEKERPSLTEFSGPDIKKDQLWLEQQRQKKNQEKTSRSRILEYIIIDQSERSDWLGENSLTYQTTEYDDRHNHADLVLEITKDGKSYYLAIDVTSSESDYVLWDKEATIRQEIKSGQLTNIKYFKGKNQKTELKNLPRVILALDWVGVQRLCKDLVKKKPKDLGKNPEQILILEQIRDQMSDQIEYALNLLLDEIGGMFKTLDKEEKKELILVLKEARHLASQPQKLPKVLEILTEQKKLLNRLTGFPSITRYLNVISRQKTIYQMAQDLIKEKSGLVEKPAAETKEQNIVLRHTRSHLRQYDLPAQLKMLV